MASLAIASVIQVGTDHPLTGALKNAGHRSVAACALPDLTIEGFMLEKGKGGPGWGREEVGALKIRRPLCGRFEATIEVVSRVHPECPLLRS